MPELSRFYGLVIQMYYLDHAPPHFHVRLVGGEPVAKVRIDDLEVI